MTTHFRSLRIISGRYCSRDVPEIPFWVKTYSPILAWDILLELLAAKLAGHGVPLLELTKAVEAPVSVVARWIGILKERGLVQSEVGDGSIHFFSLSPDGASRLEKFGKRWASAFVSI